MTGIKIESISDEQLKMYANKADKNCDGKLKGEEYQVFVQMASQNGVDYKTIGDTLQMNAFERWWFDVDKVSTDGNDDGKLSAGEKAESFGKGLLGGIVKGIVKNPLTTAAIVAASAGLIIATGGAAAVPLLYAGAAFGATQIGIGAYKAAKATSDGEAKAAWEGIGTGTAMVGLAAAGVKSANKAAANAGVKSLQGMENASYGENVVAGFKAIPESMKVSGMNIKGNVLTWTSAVKGDKVIYANSNATRTNLQHTVQNSKVEAYKVDLNGTVDEVLAKNPGLSYDAETVYFVQTSWGEKSVISSDNYMIVKYATGDYNAVDAVGFKPYTDPTTGMPINITELKAGQAIMAEKAGKPVTYKIAEAGTKYMSAEGEHTLQPGSVLRFDDAGRPYQSTVEFMLNNTKLTTEQVAELVKLDPVKAVQTQAGAAYIKSTNPQQYIELVTPEKLMETREGVQFLVDNEPAKAVELIQSQMVKRGVNVQVEQANIATYNDDIPGWRIKYQYNGKTFDITVGGRNDASKAKGLFNAYQIVTDKTSPEYTNLLSNYNARLQYAQNYADKARGYDIDQLKFFNRQVWYLQGQIEALEK